MLATSCNVLTLNICLVVCDYHAWSLCLQGEAGVSALDALSRCPLQQLCLLGTDLGSKGSTKLVECFDQGGFASLQELSVSACNLELETGLLPLLDALMAGKAPSLKVKAVLAAAIANGCQFRPVLIPAILVVAGAGLGMWCQPCVPG